MDLLDAINKYILVIYEGLTDKVEEVANLIAMSPGDLFATDFWDTLLKTASLALMPFALAILGFFLASELYDLYCRSDGELDAKRVSATVFRFIIPYFVVLRSYDILQIVFTLFNGILKSLSSSLTVTLTPIEWDYQALLDSVSGQPFLSQIAILAQMQGPYLAVTVMGGVIWIIVYGRLFEMMLYWLVAPLPLATLPSKEHSQIAKTYLKNFAAIMLQGVLMLLCVVIYSALSWSNVNTTTIDWYSTWNLIWPMAILIFALLKTGTMAKRMCGTF